MKTFVKEYKNNEQLRNSFSRLAKETFGIDFESWYQTGSWNDNYICFSYIVNSEIIANVSVNKMDVLSEGTITKAIQIGTVMTDPTYRNQGLASALMEKVFEEYDSTCDLYFLAANERAIPLYEKMGFTPWEETSFTIDVTDYPKLGASLIPVEISPEAFLQHKLTSVTLSNKLSIGNDEHVWMFYYVHGFRNCLYDLKNGVTVIAEFEGETCHLYGILSEHRVELEKTIQSLLHEEVTNVICHFTVEEPLKGLSTEGNSSNHWMIRSMTGTSFPKNTRFPKLAQA